MTYFVVSSLDYLDRQNINQQILKVHTMLPLISYYLTPPGEELIVELVDRLKKFLAGFDE